jgi:rsbT co-antagonist protein RsbR
MAATRTAATPGSARNLSAIIREHRSDLIRDWARAQTQTDSGQRHRLTLSQATTACEEMLDALSPALDNDVSDPRASAYDPVREVFQEVGGRWAREDWAPTEIFFAVNLVRPLLIPLLQARHPDDATALRQDLLFALMLFDDLSLAGLEQVRDELMNRQSEQLLELSLPVIKLWDGILAVPIIGTLDSERAQAVTESLLTELVRTNSSIAIIDITGVAAVDTSVAQHLITTAAAAQLMGADCIISGLRPQIAQAIVNLGVDLTGVTTKATLAHALAKALDSRGLQVTTRSSP